MITCRTYIWICDFDRCIKLFSFADCDDIFVEYISWGDAEAVVTILFSVMGLIATFLTCHIFIRHNDTPVVKASTRELSYLILAGMTLAHIAVSPRKACLSFTTFTLNFFLYDSPFFHVEHVPT